jgi:hypothetical protein
MREGNPLKLTGIPQRKPQENDAIPKIAPKWLKYDKQVCGNLAILFIISMADLIHNIGTSIQCFLLRASS